MQPQKQHSIYIKRILFHAAKFPLLYLCIGIALVILSCADDIIYIPHWKNYLDISNKIGLIIILLAFLLFIYNACVSLCLHYELKLHEQHAVGAMVIRSIRKSLRIIFILVAIHIMLTIISPEQIYATFAQNIIKTIIIGSLGWIALQILYTFEALLYQKMVHLDGEQHSRAKALYTKIHIIKNIATVLIIVLTIAAILMTFSSVRNIGISLLASAGLLTAVVGLAAQKPLYSIFSGIQLALAEPIKLGDYIVMDGVAGTIEEITFTYATLKLGDKRRLIVPLNSFLEKHFENWSRVTGSLISSINLRIDYAMPLQPLREELTKILKASANWDKHTGKLQVTDLTDRGVGITIQVSAINPDTLSNLRAEVREKILEFLRENYPQYFPLIRFNDLNDKTTADDTSV